MLKEYLTLRKREEGLGTLASRVKLLVDHFHDGSVNDAAKALGVAQPTIGRILKGEVTQPRVQLIQRMATLYGASLDWLLAGTGDPPVKSGEQPWHRKWSIFLQSQFPEGTDGVSSLEYFPSLAVLAARRWGQEMKIRDAVATAIGNAAAAQVAQVWRKLLTDLANAGDWDSLARAIAAQKIDYGVGRRDR
jgi:transcriptional regulator with XRE-family HTH domain